ncbi:hypothetical protein ACFPYI_14525 [Halomarina salina]|uniref:Major facilitator superfamily (MFS) profile domain-containing protein n=1 Tax=Halomarina salina TaxID=1872699 RepID=A0ABD5RPJ7_9EURY|nr:hypothetical protein [Halomarina salina]
MDVEQSTTLVQGVGFIVGGALALLGAGTDASVGGVTLTALGVGVVAVGFVVATVGSLLTSSRATSRSVTADKRIQAGLQGLAAAGFVVLFVALAADLGLVAVLAGAALILAALAARWYLEKRE